MEKKIPALSTKKRKQTKLNKIKKEIELKLKCSLKTTATNIVFGKGSPAADILFIGEAPGEKEDLSGLPFVGRAGKQLDKHLNKISLTIEDVYIANILKYRPPKNRDPKIDEIINHTPYLIEQMKTIRPKIIATLGNFSSKFILALAAYKPKEETFKEFMTLRLKKEMKKIPGISEIHGKEHIVTFNRTKFKVIPVFHPAAMMYNPKTREHFENDFKIMAEIIGTKIQKDEVQKTLV